MPTALLCSTSAVYVYIIWKLKFLHASCSYEGPTPTAYKQNNILTLPLTKWLLINLQQRPNICRATDAASDAVLLTCTTRGKTPVTEVVSLFQIYRPYLLTLPTPLAINVTRLFGTWPDDVFLRTYFPRKLSTPDTLF
jgi:hypothetical protein